MIPAESSDLTVQVPNDRRSWIVNDRSWLGLDLLLEPIFADIRSIFTNQSKIVGSCDEGRGTNRSVTFATKEARFHSMNLDIREE